MLDGCSPDFVRKTTEMTSAIEQRNGRISLIISALICEMRSESES